MIRAPKKIAGVLLWTVAGVGLLAVIFSATRRGQADTEDAAVESVHLIGTTTLELEPEVIFSIGVRTSQVEPAGSHQRLTLSGSTMVDSNKFSHMHARFAGEVVSIGPNVRGTGEAANRPLQWGDHVNKNQLLAVLWSKDVGEKKSNLVDSLSQLYLDKLQWDRLKNLKDSVVRDADVRQAQRAYEQDIIAVQVAERTLRSWRLTEAEIDALREEAERIHRGEFKPEQHVEKSWAEVEVRAPLEGVLLEQNMAVGDIVDTDLDLFKIADMRKLCVMANTYEEDIPALQGLGSQDQHWTIRLKSEVPDSPGIPGTFDMIGSLIDPTQHTCPVRGWLPNPDEKLRAGQFITATIELPPQPNEVAVPEGALVQEGAQSTVFIAADSSGKKVARRTIAVVRRANNLVYVRSQPSAEEKSQGCEAIHAGEWIVVSGTIELAGALQDKLALVQNNSSKQ